MQASYHRLTAAERITIAALRQKHFTITKIANHLGRPRQTIYAELKRNTGQRGYRPKQAQKFADQRLREKVSRVGPRKMTPPTIAYIEAQIREKHSPEQIAATMNRNARKLAKHGVSAVSYETIYRHVFADQKARDELWKHLRQRVKKRKPRRNQRDRRGQIKGRVSISKRPKSVESRRRLGHWEADLMSGKAHKGFNSAKIKQRFSGFE